MSVFTMEHIKQMKDFFLIRRNLIPFGSLIQINIKEISGQNMETCTYLVVAKVSVRGETLLD